MASLPLGIPADPSFEARSEDESAPARHLLCAERIAKRLGIYLPVYCREQLKTELVRLNIHGANVLLDLLESELQRKARAA